MTEALGQLSRPRHHTSRCTSQALRQSGRPAELLTDRTDALMGPHLQPPQHSRPAEPYRLGLFDRLTGWGYHFGTDQMASECGRIGKLTS